MANRSRVTAWGAISAAMLMSIWLLSTEPFGLGVFQLLVFTAPGAMLGLGAGWMAHATRRSAWNWETGRNAAFLGAATLPPLLAFLIAVDGTARPQQLLVGFVIVAWVALAGGLVVAAVRRPRRISRSRRRAYEWLRALAVQSGSRKNVIGATTSAAGSPMHQRRSDRRVPLRSGK